MKDLWEKIMIQLRCVLFVFNLCIESKVVVILFLAGFFVDSIYILICIFQTCQLMFVVIDRNWKNQKQLINGVQKLELLMT